MTDTGVWEYQDRFYEFKGQPMVEGNYISNEMWNQYEAVAFDLMRAELNAGWQVDQDAWGTYCIKYEKRRRNLLSHSPGAWLVYILIGFITYGAGFIIAPFFMNRDYLQLRGINVRLMRAK
jgi:hypothetical protein